MASQPRRARALADNHEFEALLRAANETREAPRNVAAVFLSFDAGLRVCEIVRLKRRHIETPNGNLVDTLILDETVSKRTPGRRIDMKDRPALRLALIALLADAPGAPDDPLIGSTRRGGSQAPPGVMRPDSLAYLLYRLFRRAKLDGCSSFSGRRTYVSRVMGRGGRRRGTVRTLFENAGLAHLGSVEPYADARPLPDTPPRQLRLF